MDFRSLLQLLMDWGFVLPFIGIVTTLGYLMETVVLQIVITNPYRTRTAVN